MKSRVTRALEEALDVLRLCDGDGRRAERISAPEDAEILAICKRIGYGAVMDSAARQWFKKDPIGAQTSGPCAATVRNAVKQLEAAALVPREGQPMTDAGARQRLVQRLKRLAPAVIGNPYCDIRTDDLREAIAALSEGEAPSVIERPATYQIHPRDREEGEAVPSSSLRALMQRIQQWAQDCRANAALDNDPELLAAADAHEDDAEALAAVLEALEGHAATRDGDGPAVSSRRSMLEYLGPCLGSSPLGHAAKGDEHDRSTVRACDPAPARGGAVLPVVSQVDEPSNEGHAAPSLVDKPQ